ncbi:nuclease harbi1 [Elysia marginata]|uniref:Nuclease harbi1 n=1 Tax=Elysia marginata TaxID=1093978 RepID=A0AAV4GXU0_9GAST|nr:nuclease harbi1 [Elysia marginata]
MSLLLSPPMQLTKPAASANAAARPGKDCTATVEAAATLKAVFHGTVLCRAEIRADKSATKTARLFISMGEKSRLVLPRRFQCISSFYIKMAKLKRSLLLACVAEQLHLEDTLINLYVAQLKSKKRPRYWVHDIIKNRKIHGAYYHLVRELELDTDRYKEYFQMSPRQLEMVLSFVEPMIQKRAVVREPTHNTARLKSRVLGRKK